MVEDLKAENFLQQLNTPFHVEVAPAQTVELKLVEVQDESNGMPQVPGQERFALYFTGPGDSFLQQQTYPMRHEHVGDFHIFLVPVGREAEGFRYEAVFNRLIR